MSNSRRKLLEAELSAIGVPDTTEAIEHYFKAESLQAEGERLAAAEALSHAISLADAPTFHIRFSAIMLETNNVPDAIIHAKQAIEIAEKLDHALLYSAACEQMAKSLLSEREFEKAEAFILEAQEVSTSIKDKKGEVRAINLLGALHTRTGRLDSGIKLFEKALSISTSENEKRGQADALGNLGMAHYSQGRLDEALEHSQKALLLHTELEDKMACGMDHYHIAMASERLDKTKDAKESYERALAIFIDLKMKTHENEAKELLDDLDNESS